MPSTADQQTVAQPRTLECAVTAYAASGFSFAEVNALRKQSATLPGNFGFSVLKHAEEQTMAGLGTLRDALVTFESRPADFGDWGVVCSSRYLGRSAFVESLGKFAAEGPWNVSVQVVPHRSLHSPASMLGLALGCHGPCVGVGGGLDGETDAWITAMTLLDQQPMPGIWLCFLGWDPDELIDMQGNQVFESRCTGLLLALQPVSTSSAAAKARIRLSLDMNSPKAVDVPAVNTAWQLFEKSLPTASAGGALTTSLGGCLRLEMDWLPNVEHTIPVPAPLQHPEKKAA